MNFDIGNTMTGFQPTVLPCLACISRNIYSITHRVITPRAGVSMPTTTTLGSLSATSPPINLVEKPIGDIFQCILHLLFPNTASCAAHIKGVRLLGKPCHTLVLREMDQYCAILMHCKQCCLWLLFFFFFVREAGIESTKRILLKGMLFYSFWLFVDRLIPLNLRKNASLSIALIDNQTLN